MRKFINHFIFIASLFISANIYGQIKKFHVGVEAGPSLVSLRGNSALNNYQKSKISFSAGFFAQYLISKSLSLITNILFERKGCSFGTHDGYDSIFQPAKIKEVFNHDYITLPVLLRAISGNNRRRFFIGAGPYIAFLVRQTDKSKINDGPTTSMNNTAKNKKLDAGISGGTGFEISLKKDIVFSFEVRDNLGLMNTSKIPVIDNGSIKTNALIFLLGCTFK